MAQFNSLLVTGNSRFLNPINGNARNGIYYVKGTQTAATGSWTGSIPIPALYDGLTIMYYLPYNGSGNATLNLTLSDGTTTGAKNCYYSTSRLSTQYGAGQNVVMTYHPAGSISVSGTATSDDRWVVTADNNSDSTKVAKVGDTVTGSINRDSGGSWILARDNCVVKQTKQTQGTGSSWNPVVGIKTWAGHWSFGTVGGETLCLSYDTDSNYSSNNNTSKVIYFPSSGSEGTVALTSQIPTNNNQLTNGAGYITSSGSCAYATSAGSAAPTSGSAYYIQNNVGSSRATTTSGSWISMLNSTQTGSPTLPTSSQWWTVLSADCWNSSPYNWMSQLAIATQDTSGVWWRRNDSGSTSIDSSTWHRLAEGDSDGNALYAISAGSATDSTKMPLAGGTFTGIVTHNKSIHGSSGETIYGAEARRSQWYKLTLATNGLTPPTSNQWYMCSFTLNMAGDYSNTPKGSVYVSYYIYWNGSAFSADKVFATAFGNNMNKVAVYYKLTDPFILYIDSSNAYSAMWIDKISYRDSGDAYRTRDTVLETTSAITTSEYSSIPISCFYTYDGSQLYTNKSLLPDGNNALNLGASDKKWANGYFTNINGVAVGDSPKFTDNNTTYTLGTNGNNVTLTPSNGSVQNITVPYATNAGTVNNLTVQTAVPANAVFTDTKVTQTVENGGSTSGDYYGILLANTKLSDSTETAGVKKTPNSDLAYSPTDHRIRINGTTSSYGRSIGGLAVYSVNNNGVNIGPDGINLFDTSYNDTITLTNTTGAITANSITCNSMSVTDISDQYTFTRTSGPWTCQGIRAVRCGNVVTMQVIIRGGTSVSDGSNGIQGTISGGPLPARVNGGTQDMGVQGINFYGVSALVGQLNSSGTFTLRLLIHSQSMGSNSTSISFTFVCD